MEKPRAHLKDGIKRVIISFLSSDVLVSVICVNHEKQDSYLNVVSDDSSTCLASTAEVISDNSDVMERFMTVVYGITATQKTMDSPSGEMWFDSCGSAQNIIPVSTGRAEVIAEPPVCLFSTCCLELTCPLEEATKHNTKRSRAASIRVPHEGILALQRIRLSPMTLTVIPTLLPMVLGLTGIALNNHFVKSFPDITTNLAIATEW
ncbi:Glyceraldehyde-3-phosphate dehydrogenase [Fukomys damarensis]|uniref:glyceraldehyde-3-phosphate dehydrogenase (phosphorylating) n=1 Tax=Fukomys damarensis TaxID=885580 RepID=A0A091D4X0_FUKDA|nr:Glyceraldehyde-3-phosphate dehydrogenase [Fukomys damarensis]